MSNRQERTNNKKYLFWPLCLTVSATWNAMGFFLDEHGDPKGWAGCLLCGLAAMGEDELEAAKDKKKEKEREERLAAEMEKKAMAENIAGASNEDGPRQPSAAQIAERDTICTADEILPVVTEQPWPLKPMPPMPVALPLSSPPRSPTQEKTASSALPSSSGSNIQPPKVATSRARPISILRSPVSLESPTNDNANETALCSVCDSHAHDTEDCPHSADFAAEPSKAMSQFTADDYAVLNPATVNKMKRGQSGTMR